MDLNGRVAVRLERAIERWIMLIHSANHYVTVITVIFVLLNKFYVENMKMVTSACRI